jgi:hypothetical protein
MLTTGTIVRRNRDCSHRPNALAEIVELDEEAHTWGGNIYQVSVLSPSGGTEYWNSNYFTIERPKEFSFKF